MSLLCKNIGECMRVKITKRAQADEVSILLTARKILCFNGLKYVLRCSVGLMMFLVSILLTG
jgi:hypothetical protein